MRFIRDASAHEVLLNGCLFPVPALLFTARLVPDPSRVLVNGLSPVYSFSPLSFQSLSSFLLSGLWRRHARRHAAQAPHQRLLHAVHTMPVRLPQEGACYGSVLRFLRGVDKESRTSNTPTVEVHRFFLLP